MDPSHSPFSEVSGFGNNYIVIIVEGVALYRYLSLNPSFTIIVDIENENSMKTLKM